MLTDLSLAPPDPDALHRALLAHDSATAVLEAAYGGPVHIRRLAVGPVRPDAALRAVLRVEAGEAVLHRHVNLLREARVLSEADLWYVPARLTPAMAETLLATDVPFGRVVAALRPRRVTLSASVHPAGPVAVEHRALLLLQDDLPLALVHERYPRSV